MPRIILDTDLGMGAPGSDIDDGFALALAVADPDISVELVTTVNGNTDVDTATRLTLDLLQRLDSTDIEVCRGAESPLLRTGPRPRADVRVDPPGTDGRSPAHASARMVERVMAEPGELTIVAIGPLTNVALAVALEPRLASAVAEIIVMGGVYLEHTNTSVLPGEFNFWVDPEAAAMVLASGAPLRLVGLDVTRRVRLGRDDAAGLAGSDRDSGFARFAAACTQEWIVVNAAANPADPREQDSCALHDPLAVAVVSHPDLVIWRPAFVTVETGSERTRGVVVADLLTGRAAPAPNCMIGTDVDAGGFLRLFRTRLASLP